jgi:hypothetical protein
MSAPSYVTLTGPQATVFIVTASLPANAGAGTVVQASIQIAPQLPAVSSVVVPSTEVWSIVDLYTLTTYSPDAAIQLYINGYLQDIYPTLNSVYINNYKKWTLTQAIKLPPTASWTIQLVTLGAVGSSAVSVTLYISAIRAPFVAVSSKSS